MIWKPGDCYTMTVPLHTAGLLSPKCSVDAGLGAGRQPDWILGRICGKKIVHRSASVNWAWSLPEKEPKYTLVGPPSCPKRRGRLCARVRLPSIGPDPPHGVTTFHSFGLG